MFTPQDAIAKLDAAIGIAGETMVLRKGNAATPSVTIKGHVRNVSTDEIDGTTIRQNDKKVVLSPTGLNDFGLPKAGWYLVTGGNPRAIIGTPDYMKMANVVVRIEMFVKG